MGNDDAKMGGRAQNHMTQLATDKKASQDITRSLGRI